ncbi:AAA family ATPase, partial [Anaerosporobacter sp.]
MSIIVKTPFKSDGLETDPMVYGLRPSELRQGIIQLYNDKSLLITGSRGIGKSSLCYQLQKIMQGDNIILNRCGLDISMHEFITINYICTPDDTLETIVYSILNELERKLVDCNKKYKLKLKEFDVQIFGFLKAKIENKSTEKEQFVTLVNSFVEVIHSFRETYVDPHINISLDELDQIKSDYNVAHFLKAVLEQLDKKGEGRFLSFILVGQNCLYNLLYDKQPAFHRLVKHIRLFPLDEENSSYVLDACLKRAKIYTEILDDAERCFLSLTNGYPYFIQLLGDETFNCMLSRYVNKREILTIKLDDVLSGLKNVIICEQQRYEILIEQLDDNIKSCI